MNQTDARNFILALNAVAQFVPPLHMQPLMANPICKVIEHLANTPEQSDTATQEGASGPPINRPKPHAVP